MDTEVLVGLQRGRQVNCSYYSYGNCNKDMISVIKGKKRVSKKGRVLMS